MFCSIYRFLISRSMDSGSPLPGRVERHVQRCPTCRRFASDAASLGASLAEEAAMLTEPLAPELQQRVLRAVCRSGSANRLTAQVRLIRWAPVPLAAAAAVLVFAIGMALLGRGKPSPISSQTAPVQAAAAIWVPSAAELASHSSAALDGYVKAPLISQLGGLAEDGKAVVEFLASYAMLNMDGGEPGSSTRSERQ